MTKTPQNPKGPAVLLAAFGAARPQALQDLLTIEEQVRAALPQAAARLCFTSQRFRYLWSERARDPSWIEANPQIPHQFLKVRGPLAAVGELSDQGFDSIIVQSLHVFAGGEYLDLRALIRGIAKLDLLSPSNRPAAALAVGRPLLGEPGGPHPYTADLEAAARALAPQVAEAHAQGAFLVYVGHGSRNLSSGIYHELELILERDHPGIPVLIGALDGPFGLEHIGRRLAALGAKKVLLRPLLVAAGAHVLRDICGPGPDSWKSALENLGLQTVCCHQTLAANHMIVEQFIQHIRDAAQENHIPL